MEPHAPSLSAPVSAAERSLSYSRQSLLDRARALVPLLTERAADTADARRVPEKTIAAFWDAGLFHLLKPKTFGGPEVRADAVFEIAAVLARGDGSAAWVWNLLGMHDLFVALLPLQAQQEYWAKDRTLGASSFAANGRAKLATGGFSLSGKWSFCSGVDCADWMLLVPNAIRPRVPPHPPMRGLPKSAGSSSPNPTAASSTTGTSWASAAPAAKASWWTTLSFPSIAPSATTSSSPARPPAGSCMPAPSIVLPSGRSSPWAFAPRRSASRGASESFVQEMKTRVWGMDYAPQAKNPAIQLRLAEATAMIDAADLLYHRALTETIDKIMADQTPSVEDRVRSRRDQAYAVRTATRAVELLLDAQGGKGLYEGGHVQRAFRDLHALSAHIMAGWDMPALCYGQVALGGTPTNPYY